MAENANPRFTTGTDAKRGGWIIYDTELDKNARFGNTVQGRDLARRQAKLLNEGANPDYLVWDEDGVTQGDMVGDVVSGQAEALTEAQRQRRDGRIVAIRTLVEQSTPDPATLTALRTLGVTEAELDALTARNAS